MRDDRRKKKKKKKKGNATTSSLEIRTRGRKKTREIRTRTVRDRDGLQKLIIAGTRSRGTRFWERENFSENSITAIENGGVREKHNFGFENTGDGRTIREREKKKEKTHVRLVKITRSERRETLRYFVRRIEGTAPRCYGGLTCLGRGVSTNQRRPCDPTRACSLYYTRSGRTATLPDVARSLAATDARRLQDKKRGSVVRWRIFSDISRRNNDYSDTLDSIRWREGNV